MTPNELKEIHIKAKRQWIDDNISRLETYIHLHETILEENKTLTEEERERMTYQSYLAYREVTRFKEMRKKGATDGIQDH